MNLNEASSNGSQTKRREQKQETAWNQQNKQTRTSKRHVEEEQYKRHAKGQWEAPNIGSGQQSLEQQEELEKLGMQFSGQSKERQSKAKHREAPRWGRGANQAQEEVQIQQRRKKN